MEVGRAIYHVRKGENGIWEVLREGFSRPHLVGQTKEEAVLLAKRLAKLSSSGQVVIHSPNDLEEQRFSYHLLSSAA